MKIVPFVLAGCAILAGCLRFSKDANLVYCQDFESESLASGEDSRIEGRIVAGELIEGKFGKALHVNARKPGAFVSLPAGAVGLKGCAEFWAKLDNGAGSYTSIFDPAFFIIRSPDCPGFYLGWSANEGHGMSGIQFHT